MYEKGIRGMEYSISNTAEYGDLTRGKRVIGEASRAAMKEILAEIEAGGEKFDELRKAGTDHEIEKVGKELRDMMPWIDQGF